MSNEEWDGELMCKECAQFAASDDSPIELNAQINIPLNILNRFITLLNQDHYEEAVKVLNSIPEYESWSYDESMGMITDPQLICGINSGKVPWEKIAYKVHRKNIFYIYKSLHEFIEQGQEEDKVIRFYDFAYLKKFINLMLPLVENPTFLVPGIAATLVIKNDFINTYISPRVAEEYFHLEEEENSFEIQPAVKKTQYYASSKRCTMCCSTENLEVLNHQIRGTDKVSLPICFYCNLGIKRFQREKEVSKRFIWFGLIAILYPVFDYLYIHSLDVGFLVLFLFLGFVFFSISIYLYLKNRKYKIEKYVKQMSNQYSKLDSISNSGPQILVKPKCLNDWVDLDLWISNSYSILNKKDSR